MVLTDDSHVPSHRPTRANIISAMQWLVSGAQPNDSLFFHCECSILVDNYIFVIVRLRTRGTNEGSRWRRGRWPRRRSAFNANPWRGSGLIIRYIVIYPVDHGQNGHITDDVGIFYSHYRRRIISFQHSSCIQLWSDLCHLVAG